MISQVGALVHFLPPYSSDLNPIEECFSKVKSTLRRMETNTNDDLETHLPYAFMQVTSQDCKGWTLDSGVHNI